MNDPIELFQQWLAEARSVDALSHPGAFCLSTIDERGFPEARYVDLKRVDAEGFLFGTRLDSPKARSIARDPRVSMTFWWDPMGRQVRIVGSAIRASHEEADALFEDRPHPARVVSLVSAQSEPLADPAELARRFRSALESVDPRRPEHWGAFWIRPETIEFLRFDDSRLHERRLYRRADDGEGWVCGWLQP